MGQLEHSIVIDDYQVSETSPKSTALSWHWDGQITDGKNIIYDIFITVLI